MPPRFRASVLASLLTALGASLLTSAAAFGQDNPPPRQPGGEMRGAVRGGGVGGILQIPDVQQELKLTDAEKAQLAEALEKVRPSRSGRPYWSLLAASPRPSRRSA